MGEGYGVGIGGEGILSPFQYLLIIAINNKTASKVHSGLPAVSFYMYSYVLMVSFHLFERVATLHASTSTRHQSFYNKIT